MSSLSEKIQQTKIAQKEYQRIYSEEYRRAIWTLMIAFGGPIYVPEHPTSYVSDIEIYSGRINSSVEQTKEIINFLTKDNIDWEKLCDPAERFDFQFDGTDNEPLKVPYLKGELLFKNREPIVWLTRVGTSSTSFPNLIQMLQLDITFEEALEHLKERLTKDQWGFTYSGTIPTIS